jgi:hypothetical protein
MTALRDEAGATEAPSETPTAPIVGSDRDARTDRKRAPQRRARRRRPRLTLACRDADAARAPRPTGLVITNPPYGHRLGDARAAARGYRDLGRLLRAHFRGWRAAVVTPAKLDGERQLGLRPAHSSARFPSPQRGLAIVLHVFDRRMTRGEPASFARRVTIAGRFGNPSRVPDGNDSAVGHAHAAALESQPPRRRPRTGVRIVSAYVPPRARASPKGADRRVGRRAFRELR